MEVLFQNALADLKNKLPDLLETNLPNHPKEYRDLLANLGATAFDSLRAALYPGSDRLAAVKLVMQLCGLTSDQTKSPKSSKSPKTVNASKPSQSKSVDTKGIGQNDN